MLVKKNNLLHLCSNTNLMDYTNFKVEDFLTDDSFVNYCYDLNNADKAHWENINLTQPLLKKKIADARELCLLLSIKISKEEKQEALARLKDAIAAEQIENKISRVANVRRLWMPRIAIAATILMLAIGFGVYNYNSQQSAKQLYSQITNDNYHTVAQTNFSNRKIVVLPDGTTVTLNGSSAIKIANDYNKDNRHVLLAGEAFFEVTKDKTRPFVVLTSKTATTALGTSFKVSSYTGAKNSSVMLSTGKVKVEATHEKSDIKDQVLIPGQQVVLAEGGSSFSKSNFDQAEISDWKNSRLVFSNADFKEIAVKLSNTYGVQLKADAKQMEHIRFTGQFSNKSIVNVLDAIGFVNNFTYQHNGNVIKLVNNSN